MSVSRKRDKTMPGLGTGTAHAAAKAPGVRASGSVVARPAQRWAPRQTMPIISQDDDDGWPEERTRPMPRVLDEVGAATAAMASGNDTLVRPRCVVSAQDVRSANIGPREAFVLSLLDGQLTLRAVLEVAGMREDLVVTSLDRLAGLGIVRF
ncbi:MAG TPA: hypothetical protein VIF62_11975 [Labilithrix sp.]|jgi:hypothetical protein